MLDKIINDEDIKKIINNINEVIIKDNCGCHGMNHALRVMSYVETILKGIGANDHDIETGKIAAYLHDIGALEGKEGHALRSARFVEKYLKSISMNDEDIDNIVYAIENHSKGPSIKHNIAASLTFADKIDMFKDRMLRYKENNYFHDNIKHMLNIEVSVDETSIFVNVVTDGLFDSDSLKDYSKMITKPIEMASYLNRNCIFLIDNKILDLSNFINIK